MNDIQTRALLEEYLHKYNRVDFIHDDPVSIPHRFGKKQDIEISGLFAAMLAWGQRKTIINNCGKLMQGMDHAPHDFVINHSPAERKRFEGFVHRTFQYPDLLYFLEFLQWYYRKNESLEQAFIGENDGADLGIALDRFRDLFFSLEHLPRTRKHLQSPSKGSACKRINLYLRWMVRQDDKGVDFGIWKSIKPAQLLCPLDVHVHRAATQLKLITRKQADWQSTLILTEKLRQFCPEDPVKYDFALFGLSLEKL